MRRQLILILVVAGIFLMGAAFTATVYAEDNTQASRRERVHNLIVTRLANGLNLSPSEAQQLGEVLKKHRQRKHRLRREIRFLTGQLRQETSSGNEKGIKTTLNKLQEARDNLDRSDEIMFSEVKTMLNANQQAQFVLIMDEIRHEVRAVRRRGRGYPRDGIQSPGTQQPQRSYTNQPTPSGVWRSYGPAPQSPNGAWVGN